ncbi:amino acid permease, partial [Acidianus sp. DSM 29099]|nr:amino acid permease [Acidianus sp. RZ1]
KTKVPIFSLIAGTIVAALFMLPFPSWESLVGFISLATVFTYIMGGIGLATLRRTAPDLKRNYKVKGAAIIAPLATLAAGLIVYWAGFPTLFYVITAIFLGLPLFFGYYAIRLGMPKNISYLLGILDLAITLAVAFFFDIGTSGLSAANNIALLIYLLIMGSLIAFNILMLNIYSKIDTVKREIKASYWLLVFIFVIFILSYFGSLGPMPIIAFPWDILVAAIAILIFHYIATISGFRTDTIEDIIERTKEI